MRQTRLQPCDLGPGSSVISSPVSLGGVAAAQPVRGHWPRLSVGSVPLRRRLVVPPFGSPLAGVLGRARPWVHGDECGQIGGSARLVRRLDSSRTYLRARWKTRDRRCPAIRVTPTGEVSPACRSPSHATTAVSYTSRASARKGEGPNAHGRPQSMRSWHTVSSSRVRARVSPT